MKKTLRFVDEMHPNGQGWYYSDLYANPTTDGTFTEVKTSGVAGITVQNKMGGQFLLDPTHGTPAQNHSDNLYTTQKSFEFGDGYVFGIRARIKVTQAATNKLNFAIGFSTLQTVGIIADGGGPAASFDGALLYISQLSVAPTVWACVSSIATTQTKTESGTTGGSSSWQDVEVEVKCVSTTEAEATFKVDGIQLLDSNGIPIKHKFTYTGGGAMSAVIAIKMGSVTPETVLLDRISMWHRAVPA